MHVLRLCSVFAAPVTALRGRGVRFDPVGGKQNHCARLSEALDRLGVRQTIVTTRPPTAPRTEDFGRHGRLVRLGPIPAGRQMYAVAAWPLLSRLRREPTWSTPTWGRTWPSCHWRCARPATPACRSSSPSTAVPATR
ncbi:hypothetical protein [Microbispora sp. CA-102843]|uniref:hypothetical protein n=1 Tax=Microbispora sp. CA-102843 TaxID=3239952 RepID=UPI003D8F7B87